MTVPILRHLRLAFGRGKVTGKDVALAVFLTPALATPLIMAALAFGEELPGDTAMLVAVGFNFFWVAYMVGALTLMTVGAAWLFLAQALRVGSGVTAMIGGALAMVPLADVDSGFRNWEVMPFGAAYALLFWYVARRSSLRPCKDMSDWRASSRVGPPPPADPV